MATLIDFSKFPDFDPTKLEHLPDKIRAFGKGVFNPSSSLYTTWQRLDQAYVAPEGDTVLHLQDSTLSEAKRVSDDMDKLAGYMKRYHDDLVDLKKRRDDLAARVATLHKNAADATYDLPYSDQNGHEHTQHHDWTDKKELNDENNKCISDADQLFADMTAAEAKFTTDTLLLIHPLSWWWNQRAKPPNYVSKFPIPNMSGYTKDQVDHMANPWGGYSQYNPQACPEATLFGAQKWWEQNVQATKTLFGSYGDDARFEAERGIGNFIVSTWVAAIAGPINAAAKAAGMPTNPISQFVDRRVDTSLTGLSGFIHYDYQAAKNGQDPWHEYAENFYSTLTQTGLNVVPVVLAAVPGGQSAELSELSLLGRLASVSSRLADAIAPTTGLLVRGVTALAEAGVKVAAIEGAASLDSLLNLLRERPVPDAAPGAVTREFFGPEGAAPEVFVGHTADGTSTVFHFVQRPGMPPELEALASDPSGRTRVLRFRQDANGQFVLVNDSTTVDLTPINKTTPLGSGTADVSVHDPSPLSPQLSQYTERKVVHFENGTNPHIFSHEVRRTADFPGAGLLGEDTSFPALQASDPDLERLVVNHEGLDFADVKHNIVVQTKAIDLTGNVYNSDPAKIRDTLNGYTRAFQAFGEQPSTVNGQPATTTIVDVTTLGGTTRTLTNPTKIMHFVIPEGDLTPALRDALDKVATNRKGLTFWITEVER